MKYLCGAHLCRKENNLIGLKMGIVLNKQNTYISLTKKRKPFILVNVLIEREILEHFT